MSDTTERSEAQIEYDRTVKERVERGIALLQKEYGEDWVDHIDLDRFDITDGASCVLGQVYDNEEPTDEQRERAEEAGIGCFDEGYGIGRAIIDGDLLTDAGVVGHGFEGRGDTDNDDWMELQQVWHREIERLQLERAQAAT